MKIVKINKNIAYFVIYINIIAFKTTICNQNWLKLIFLAKNRCMNEFSFYIEDKYLYLSIAKALSKCVDSKAKNLVFVFVGSDCNIGDSLAPLCSALLNVSDSNVFIYGNLGELITAKEVPFMSKYLKYAHPDSIIIVIDAAIGKKWDIGRVKVQNFGIKPGLGVNKDLPMLGDISIIGVVGEKGSFKNGSLPQIRLSTIYNMAKNIAKGIETFLNEREKRSGNFKAKILGESADNQLIG